MFGGGAHFASVHLLASLPRVLLRTAHEFDDLRLANPCVDVEDPKVVVFDRCCASEILEQRCLSASGLAHDDDRQSGCYAHMDQHHLQDVVSRQSILQLIRLDEIFGLRPEEF